MHGFLILIFKNSQEASISIMEKISDIELFNELFTKYKSRFIRFAQTFTRDAAIAEDFVIDALVYYWEHRTELSEESNVPAYVLTIIKHKCLNYLQRETIIKDASERLYQHAQWELSTRIATLEACEPYEIFAAEAQKIVNETLERLPDKTREIFIMSRIHNLSHREIAERLNISYKSVEFHITKALKELRVQLKDYLPFFIYLILK